MPRPNPVRVLKSTLQSWPAQSTLIDRYSQGRIDHLARAAGDVVNGICRSSPLQQQGAWRRQVGHRRTYAATSVQFQTVWSWGRRRKSDSVAAEYLRDR